MKRRKEFLKGIDTIIYFQSFHSEWKTKRQRTHRLPFYLEYYLNRNSTAL
jgi:hypothetical protein